MNNLDNLSAVFAEYMTPGEDGEPLIMAADLPDALDALGIPKGLHAELAFRMLGEDRNAATFEAFAEACQSASKADLSDDADSTFSTPKNPAEDRVFQLLSNGKEITANSLQAAAQKIKLDLSAADAEKLVEIARTRDEFADLWEFLDSK